MRVPPYAKDAAWAGGAEGRRGVALSDNDFADPSTLAGATVRMTIVAGGVVFEAD